MDFQQPSAWRQIFLTSVTPCLLLTLITVSGCGKPVDPAVLEARQRLVVDETPGEVMVVSKIRGRIEREEVEEPVDVVVRGRIHAGEVPPWETGKAAFILTDITGHEGESDHDPHTCPFCSEDINSYMAKVSFADAGEILNIDARELFDVEEKQIVTVTGKARIDTDDLLAIDADQIHIERN